MGPLRHSFILAVLSQAGLVERRQEGIWQYYFCHADRVFAAPRWLERGGAFEWSRLAGNGGPFKGGCVFLTYL